jgi:hypothetical protein
VVTLARLRAVALGPVRSGVCHAAQHADIGLRHRDSILRAIAKANQVRISARVTYPCCSASNRRAQLLKHGEDSFQRLVDRILGAVSHQPR